MSQVKATDCVIDDNLQCIACGRRIASKNVRRNCSAFPLPHVELDDPRLNDILSASQAGTPSGPGTELSTLLRDWLGIEADAGCGCRSMATKMDALGPDWCLSEAGMAEILGVMRAEHAKRWADGRTVLPWADIGARQLVRLACRRARAKASA